MRALIGILLLVIPFSAFATASKERPIIILDSGHGGKDLGARIKGIEEKKLTLRTAYLTKKHLEELGYRVILTRAKDVFVPLSTRVGLANRRPSSLFVSIHYNSAKSPSASGIEVYYYNKGVQARKEDSKNLASSVIQHMVTQTKAASRGIKQGNFQVIRDTVMPGILIEAGFITNSGERKLLATQNYLDNLAKGIALGIDQFVRGCI